MPRPTVVLELAGDRVAALARDLVAGGVFVPGCTLGFDEDCELVVRLASDEVRVAARVVWVDPAKGAGLQITDPDVGKRDRLAALARGAAGSAPARPTPVPVPVPVPVVPVPVVPVPVPETAAESETESEAETEADTESEADTGSETDTGSDSEPESDTDPDPDDRERPKRLQERLRNLPLAKQLKLANHSGDMQERVLLERMYGKTVWEALLRNPRLTGPEVARIARMGTLPRTLLELIVSNGAWLQIPEVRRALLANPRLATDQITRVLRLLPKHELKLAPTQTAYSFAVREAARKMIRDAGGGG